jgi:MoaA/NifB/PqqE/SkfB family radical SAM enzyme
MVAYAESRGIHTNLTTNGTLLGDKIDHVFSSGLRQIAFGVYRAERIPSISPQIEDLVRERSKRKAKWPVILMDITIFRESLEEIPDLIETAAASGLDAVILHRIFNVHSPDATGATAYISDDEERELFATAKALAKRRGLRLHLPSKTARPCRAIKECIFVTAEGKATPCCFLPEHVLGDVLLQGVDGVLQSRKYIDFVKTMDGNPVCSRCRM